MRSDLAATVARLVAEGDPATIRTLAQVLAQSTDSPLDAIKARRPSSADPHTFDLIDELVSSIGPAETTPSRVGEMVEAALELRDVMARSRLSSTLVWTGPTVLGSAFRTTAEAIADIVEGSNSQILISTYSLRREAPDAGRGLLARLARARERGVGVTLVLHQDAANRGALRDGWPVDAPSARLLTWPIPEGDEMVKLHAKIVEADDRALLVTSANLTYHGLFKNLELGIWVRGAVAGDVRRHFDRLERQGHLREWS